MSNSILTDSRGELNTDELEAVSGGHQWSFAQQVITGAVLGFAGITVVAAATHVVLETAQNSSK